MNKQYVERVQKWLCCFLIWLSYSKIEARRVWEWVCATVMWHYMRCSTKHIRSLQEIIMSPYTTNNFWCWNTFLNWLLFSYNFFSFLIRYAWWWLRSMSVYIRALWFAFNNHLSWIIMTTLTLLSCCTLGGVMVSKVD